MALIPPDFLDNVVALGIKRKDGTVKYSATGFLYGYPTGLTDENGEETYRLFLVTNRHVFQRITERSGELYARFNKLKGTGSSIYTIPADSRWTAHPDSANDVAVLNINAQRLIGDNIEPRFFTNDSPTFTREQALTAGVSEGDGVFILGFPLGEAGTEQNYPIVRHGILARVKDWLKGNAHTFLIDAFIFPGNSGGPVFLKPEFTVIEGTKPNKICRLIGMVSSYLPYREVAVSTQTQQVRMIFEENSGLGRVVPLDVIQETIQFAVDDPDSRKPSISDPEGQI